MELTEQEKLEILEALDFYLDNQAFPNVEDWERIKALRNRLENEWRPN